LFSKSACTKVIDEGHSGTYYFFLFLFLGAFLYLSIGMTINYIFVGARGYELIPNYDFWKKSWVTMKLGFAYVKNGCRVIPTEDSYDAI
jgi:cation-dependent mannose-6-phosphate receptor